MKQLPLICTGVLLTMLTIFSAPCLKGQNNIYKINDDVNRYYQKALASRGTDICLSYADSALSIARRVKDGKGECVALCAYLQHYSTLQDKESLNVYADKLREASERTGNMQYYYYAYSQETTYYLNHDEFIGALESAEKVRKDAELRGDSYGQYLSYRLAGHIYFTRREYSIALDSYHKALGFFKNDKELMDTQSICSTLQNIGDIHYTNEKQIDSAVWYYNEALVSATTFGDSLKSYVGLCKVYGSYQKDKEQFYKYFNIIKDSPQITPSSSMGNSILIKDAVFRKDWAAAERIAEKCSNPIDRMARQYEIAYSRGDYKLALDILNKRNRMRDSLRTEQSSSDISEYVARIGTEQIKKESEFKQHKLKSTIFQSFGLFIALALFAVIFYIYREKRNSKRLTKINEQLAVAKDKAESASRMKSLFVQNMSHEIRTPLNSIMGFSQLLTMPGMEWSEEEKTEYGKAIMNNGQLLQMLIDDILSVSDLESGNYAINPTTNDVREICKSAGEIVEYRIPGGVEFVRDYEHIPDDKAMVSTDAGRVQQILINFLTNACKHTRQGTITLGCSLTETPDCFTFSVTDTGDGVLDDMAEEIFERFAKLDAFKQGTGLGLNICRTIAELLGGKVMLDTKYKKGGARFVFILPCHRMEKF